MARKFIAIIILVTITAIFFAGSRFWGTNKSSSPEVPKSSNVSFIDYTMHTLSNNPISQQALLLKTGTLPVAGVTSHHLPTAEGFINTFYRELSAARPNATQFVIVGPDHFERCGGTASVTTKDFLTPFGLLTNDQNVSRGLIKAGADENNVCFANEHSIGVHTTFIKKYFPSAEASAIIFSSAATAAMTDKLSEVLYKQFPNAVVVASIDFSHYKSAAQANIIDSRTQKQIEAMNVSSLLLEQLDSAASLRLATAYAQLQGATPKLVSHANSFDFTGDPDNTTGYFNVIFGK